MKKKILSFLMAICLVLPFGFALTACGNSNHECSKATEWSSDDTHHWKACTGKDCDEIFEKEEHDFSVETIEATIDADGKTIKTCSVCSKVVETTIPKISQTRAEMIAVLRKAVKLGNYNSVIQETFTYKTNTNNYYTALTDEIVEVFYTAKKFDGTVVNYVTSNEKPYSYSGSEFITSGSYFEKSGDIFEMKNIGLDDMVEPTKTELTSIYNVGNNYSERYVRDNIKENLDYLLDINDEATVETVLQNTLAKYLPTYQEMFASYFGDEFTFNVEDIEANIELYYEDGKYHAVGTIVLDELEHANSEAEKLINDFLVDFEVIYTEDLVIKNYSKLTYRVDALPEYSDDELVEIYAVNDYEYTRDIDETHFTKIKAIIDGDDGDITAFDTYEEVRINVNGTFFDSDTVKFGTKVNDVVDEFVSEYLVANNIDEYATIAIYTDAICSQEYSSAEDVIVDDYFGTDIYIMIEADEGYSVVVTNYTVRFDNIDFETVVGSMIEVVEKTGTYDLAKAYINPDYDPFEEEGPENPMYVDFDDRILINGNSVSGDSFEVAEPSYIIEYCYYTTVEIFE